MRYHAHPPALAKRTRHRGTNLRVLAPVQLDEPVLPERACDPVKQRQPGALPRLLRQWRPVERRIAREKPAPLVSTSSPGMPTRWLSDSMRTWNGLPSR